MKARYLVWLAIAILSVAGTANSADDNVGGQGMCKYYACGSCDDGTVMMCPDGELSGCLQQVCSDVRSPEVMGENESPGAGSLKDFLKVEAGGVRNEMRKEIK